MSDELKNKLELEFVVRQVHSGIDEVGGISAEAGATVKERMTKYGSPKPSFERIAGMWSALLGVPITPTQVCMCMVLLKIGRESFSHQRDNLVDICGYVECAEQCREAPKAPKVLELTAQMALKRAEVTEAAKLRDKLYGEYVELVKVFTKANEIIDADGPDPFREPPSRAELEADEALDGRGY